MYVVFIDESEQPGNRNKCLTINIRVKVDMSYKEWEAKYIANSNSSGIIDKNTNKKEA